MFINVGHGETAVYSRLGTSLRHKVGEEETETETVRLT